MKLLNRSQVARLFMTVGPVAILLASCQSASPTIDPNVITTQAFETAFAQVNQPTATPAVTDTPILPTPTIPRTPPALPAPYLPSLRNPLGDAYMPRTYEKDVCQYLKDKWDPNNSAPGTIIMVIMIHGIVKNPADVGTNGITVGDFNKMMKNLKELGFEAIDTEQMANFMEHNAKIPPLAVLLTVDDRHFAEYFNDHFLDYYNQWGWHVVNAWISIDDGNAARSENFQLEKEGWVDHQSHGYIHNIPMSDSSTDEFIKGEFERSIQDLQQNFNKTPIAIIWPGGGFGVRPVQFARQYGYKLGFTTNPRGPIMFNWVPLADQVNPNSPVFLPESYVNDPLMVLPRYWPSEVAQNLDVVRNMSQEANAYAQQNRATELEYYDIVCAPTYGPVGQ